MRVLLRLHLFGVNANQIVGKPGQILRVEPVGAELLEHGVVPGLAVQTVDFEFSDGDGLGQCDQLWHALAKRSQRAGATVEQESVGFGGARLAGRWSACRNELLRVQCIQQLAYALATALGKRILW